MFVWKICGKFKHIKQKTLENQMINKGLSTPNAPILELFL